VSVGCTGRRSGQRAQRSKSRSRARARRRRAPQRAGVEAGSGGGSPGRGDAGEGAPATTGAGPGPLAPIEGAQEPRLPAIRAEKVRLDVGAPVDQLCAALEGGTVPRANARGHAPGPTDPPRLEALPVGREVDVPAVVPAPDGHRTGLARGAVGGEEEVLR